MPFHVGDELLRERAAVLGPAFDLPEPTADIAGFLNRILLDGLASPNPKGDVS